MFPADTGWWVSARTDEDAERHLERERERHQRSFDPLAAVAPLWAALSVALFVAAGRTALTTGVAVLLSLALLPALWVGLSAVRGRTRGG